MHAGINQEIQSIDGPELEYMISHGEFSPAIRNAAAKVIVVMTQDWCPQWIEMQSWLAEFSHLAAIFSSVYNLLPDFDRIRTFKEDHFGNLEVPYIRYYFRGELIAATNWLPKGTFAALLTREKPFTLR